MWTNNVENRFGLKTLVEVIKELNKFFEDETMINSVDVLLRDAEIFHPERKALLVNKVNIPQIIEDILLYDNRRNTIGEKIRKIIKYHYWKDAYSRHSEAVKFMEDHNNQNKQLLNKHQERKIMSEKFIEHIHNKAKIILGEMFDDKLFNEEEFFGLSEIDIDYVRTLCQNCDNILSENFMLDLKQYKIVKCPHCGILYLPVDRFESYKGLIESDDPEWEMKLEDVL
jgi:hypothetical protein